MKYLIRTLTLSLLATLAPFLAHAQVDPEDKEVFEGKYEDSLFAAGPYEVMISAEVDDDIFAAGDEIFFQGASGQHIFAAGTGITLENVLANDLILAGGEIVIDAQVADDVLVAGGSVEIGPGSLIAGTTTAAAGQFFLKGETVGDLRVAGSDIFISGTVGGDVHVSSAYLEIQPGAEIAGKLVYRGFEPPMVPDGATIAGGIEHIKTEPEDIGFGSTIINVLIVALNIGVLSLILNAIWPRFLAGTSMQLSGRPLTALGLGIALLITIPFVTILLFLTVIGVPVALFFMVLYAVLLISSVLVTTSCLGFLIQRLGREQDEQTLILSKSFLLTTISSIALLLLWLVPYLGGFLVILTFSVGIGSLVLASYKANRGSAPPAVES